MRLFLPALLASLLCSAPALAKPVALVRAATTQHKRSAVEATRAKKVEAQPAAPASLVALNTHETFSLRPDRSGRFDGKQLRAFANFLRCHHTGKKHAIAPRLLQLLYATAKHFDFQRLVVVAGYRAPKVARQKGNPRSPHKQGVACDFRIEGVANTTLRDYLRTKFDRVGVGYYPNSGFIHLDVRGKSAFWIDESRPGERARYTRETDEALALERAAGLDGPSLREEELDREALEPSPGPTAAAPAAVPAPTPATSGGQVVNPEPSSPSNPWGNSPQAEPALPSEPGGVPPPTSPSGG